MKYQSLYRKYRPTKFQEIYGQKNIKKILKNSIIKNQILHAYLFYGPRGTGKTSVAKMFARICNCLNPHDGECCNECINCIESIQKSCVDIIEIDAASNNGVDEIRELRNKINLVPNRLKYKVYIIDEVHMLSIGAFNALLKTLEEPPEHIIFILATTEYQKVPVTIVSRCLTLEFKKIELDDLKERLNEIAIQENINITDDALKEIAKYSDGGMRDAIGMLEQVGLFVNQGDQITIDDVHECYGMISNDNIDELFRLLQNKDKNECITFIKNNINRNKDILKIISQLLIKYRNEIIVNKNYNLINEIKKIDKYYEKIKLSLNSYIMFEMLIIELCDYTNKCLYNKNNIMQSDNKKDYLGEKEELDKSIQLKKINFSARINNCFVNADKAKLNILREKWKNLKDYSFDTAIGSLCCDLSDTLPMVFGSSYLIVSSEYQSCVDKINSKYENYEDIIKQKLNFDIKIVAVTCENWNEIKLKYINNIKSGYVYKFIDEENKENDDYIVNLNKKNDNINSSDIANKAKDLFGNIIV